MVAVSSQYNRVAIEPQTACHLLSKSGYERAMCGVSYVWCYAGHFDLFDKLGSQFNYHRVATKNVCILIASFTLNFGPKLKPRVLCSNLTPPERLFNQNGRMGGRL